jgi:hypothetical protein
MSVHLDPLPAAKEATKKAHAKTSSVVATPCVFVHFQLH